MSLLDRFLGNSSHTPAPDNDLDAKAALNETLPQASEDVGSASAQHFGLDNFDSTLEAEELAAVLESATTAERAHAALDTLQRTPISEDFQLNTSPEDTISSINLTIRQLEWLKDTVQRTPAARHKYASGLESITKCLDHNLHFFSEAEGTYFVPSASREKATFTIVQMERDIAQSELKTLEAKNLALVEAINRERKQLLVALPAYMIALETADALYDAVNRYIRGCKWMDAQIDVAELSPKSCLDKSVITKLRSNGITTYRKLAYLSGKGILGLDGIGPATLAKIQAEMERLNMPTFSSILATYSRFSEPLLHNNSYSRHVTFTEWNMKFISNKVANFEGWRVPKAISAISGNLERVRYNGGTFINHHYFGGMNRNVEGSGLPDSPYFRAKQYDYHFLKLTPLNEMVENKQPETPRAYDCNHHQKVTQDDPTSSAVFDTVELRDFDDFDIDASPFAENTFKRDPE
jgi:hypothetical protein